MMDVDTDSDFSSQSSPSSPQPPLDPDQCRDWLELPRDLTASILLRLGAADILGSAQRVCSLWRSICREPSMWRSIDMRNVDDLWDEDYDLPGMCRVAVDRSRGGLFDINLECFGDDDVLMYIADRSPQLKRLRLVSCYKMSEEGLTRAFAKLPLLVELEFSMCTYSEEAIEAAGRCLPLLTSFKLNNQAHKSFHPVCDEEALTIAKSMPGLHHLQLFGNNLSNDGLRAILNSCLHLESLDLRWCYNINLDGQLGRQCAERVKDLRRPHDPADDCPFVPDENESYEEDYPAGFSDIDIFSYDDDDYYEFSGGSDFSDYAGLYYDY